MPFWTYLLHCRDRTFYVGHTDDLDVRMAQHQAGAFGGDTARKRPVTLVWSAEFPTRDEALVAEQRIKGWRRDKKLALIRGDWEAISELARGRKGLPSTSSGQAVEGGRGASDRSTSVFLHPHLDHLPAHEFSLEAAVKRKSQGLDLRYRLTGPVETVRVTRAAAPLRRDGLWQHTCFEAFVRPAAQLGYTELNLSPSREWAAYRFASYRQARALLDIEPPESHVKHDRFLLELTTAVTLPLEECDLALNLSAIIEAKDGTKSYWALAHPPEGPPDFHHPDCFALTLPAPGAA